MEPLAGTSSQQITSLEDTDFSQKILIDEVGVIKKQCATSAYDNETYDISKKVRYPLFCY